jgi:hypothetical protein
LLQPQGWLLLPLPITGLYNTGVDNSGVAVVGSQIDQHWVLGGGTAYTSLSSGWPIGGPWVADSSTSRWITPTTNAANSLDATTNGFYTYSLTFDLAANDLLSTAWFKGQFAADDLVSSEVDTGSHEEKVSKQQSRASVLIQSEPTML